MWWKEAVFYEIVVASFQDSNDDGIGDLPGILQRLDYIQGLGVDALWLSPICASPMFDIGYDISNYREIDSRFGTLDDYRELLRQAHNRGLRIIIDYVPNHTSNQHPWFHQSRQSRESPLREYYIWRDPAPNGGPPNNWVNRFGLSAWTYDEHTEQYYFGTFAPEQPDLNWRNPAVKNEMLDVLRFWLKLGTDGVRVDALAHLIKDKRLRNNPVDSDYTDAEDPYNRLLPLYSQNQPELLGLIGDIKEVIDEFSERVFVGEVFQPPEQITAYLRAGADLLLNMSLFQCKFEPAKLQANIDRVEATTPDTAWPSRASGDHDLKRLSTRIGQENLRLGALLHFSLRGTPTMYYGEELGLNDGHIPRELLEDPSGRDDPKHGRDPMRMPMPWDASANAGFTRGQPWLPFDDDTLSKNVASQENDSHSLLNFYRRLLRLRKQEELLRLGDYTPLDAPKDVLAFRRHNDNDQFNTGLLVALNFGSTAVNWPMPQTNARVLFSTHSDRLENAPATLHLRPREGVIVRLEHG